MERCYKFQIFMYAHRQRARPNVAEKIPAEQITMHNEYHIHIYFSIIFASC